MRRIVISFIAALMLGGCGAASADDPASDHGTYEIDAATGLTTASVTTEEGNLRINSGVNIAADLPDGWTLYPEAEVQVTTNASMGDAKTVILTLISEDSPADIAAFYRDQAESNGIAAELSVTTGEKQVIAGSKGGGTGFSLIVQSQEDGRTLANLHISDGYGSSAPVTQGAQEPASIAQ